MRIVIFTVVIVSLLLLSSEARCSAFPVMTKFNSHSVSNSIQDSTLSQKRAYYKNEIALIEFVSLYPCIEGYRRFRIKGDLFKKEHAVGYDRSIFYIDSADMSRFDERTFLNDSLKDALEEIFFDIPHPEIIHRHACYNPRNAILFYDKSNSLLGIMEICFECEDVRYSAGFPMQLKFCNEQFDLLKRLFFSVGIRKGVV